MRYQQKRALEEDWTIVSSQSHLESVIAQGVVSYSLYK